MVKLSIITPYYTYFEFIKELSNVLQPQLNDEVEWIIVDDGLNEKRLDGLNATIIHLPQNSGCPGIPRNYGLDIAKGEFITFIDADDQVSADFISCILSTIDTHTFDYAVFSWESFDKSMVVNIDENHSRGAWNCSVWGVVYHNSLIGKHRFNTMSIGEDWYFNKEVLKGKEHRISNCLYYYRYGAPKIK